MKTFKIVVLVDRKTITKFLIVLRETNPYRRPTYVMLDNCGAEIKAFFAAFPDRDVGK